ncbi:LPS export ABC transporter permease LptF [Wenzhouxiangella marina]|uniref:Lipopolysaccharide export system permease protein LptF n=1 Tax=Wenzhouxiangella marina TaxID=1579979 RepID=A0A0K0XT65_9GAMM|nr:LPS export ABC transporter permease LptF [Wenzhouxiangella marina]AKS40850.1 hypothetical protein WM2015_468 [Wenzhouxiangella marina]MBB6087724.1 lipopolysaccharide export system permease protein [Wenzhouxiangella marina]
MILQRYLLRETSAASLMSLLVFVGVMLALFLAELLGDAAQGLLPAASVLRLLVLRLPEALLMVGPLALMVGVLMAIGRLGETSELAVQRAAGLSFEAMLRPLLLLILVWAGGLLLVSGWLAPAAVARTGDLMADVARQALVSGLKAGQFDRLDSGRLTVYVGSVDRQTGELTDVFVHLFDGEESEVLTAPSGRLWIDADDQRPYLSLYQGHQLRHVNRLDSPRRRSIAFERNDIRLPAPDSGGAADQELRLSLSQLRPLDTAGRFREWHWRLAAPVAALLLGLLAVPLAQRAPRQGRFGVIVLALGLYLVYTNLVHAGLVLIERRDLASGPGLWPLHALIALLAAGLLFRHWRRW